VFAVVVIANIVGVLLYSHPWPTEALNQVGAHASGVLLGFAPKV
jgi:hypothetical protein